MASISRITAPNLNLTSTDDVTGLALNSGSLTTNLPTVNSAGASVGVPQYLGVTADGAPLQWLTASGSGSSGFDATAAFPITYATTSTPFLVSTMASNLAGPISARVTMVGAGAGGSSCGDTTEGSTFAAGGGGGATSVVYIDGLTPASEFIVTTAAGGAPGVAGAPTLVNYMGSIYGANGGSVGFTEFDVALGGAPSLPSGATTDAAFYIKGGDGGCGGSSSSSLYATGFGGSTTLSGSVGTTGDTSATRVGTPGVAGAGGSGAWVPLGQTASGVINGGVGGTGVVLFEFFGAQA